MNHFRLIITSAFLWLLAPQLTAQSNPARQAENWHFGDEIAISFVDGTPRLNPPSAMKGFEGVCAMSDTNGQLLFYTNGGGRPLIPGVPDEQQPSPGVIWNRNHEVMYDMRGVEGGGYSARQSSIAFPDPGGEAGVYYLFTMDEQEFNLGGNPPDQPRGRGLSYFIIDMNLNGGLGGVRLADQRVFVPAYEGLDATPTADGNGYWVITHGNDNANPGFVIVRVDAAGVSEPQNIFAIRSQGRIKFSPNGQYLLNSGILYSFDNETGVVASDPTELPNISTAAATFTPDSRFLYTIEDRPVIGEVIVRYNARDLTEAPQPIEILAPPGSQRIAIVTAGMQIGPNGNIYYVEQGADLTDGSISYGLSEIVCVSNPTPSVNRFLVDLPQETTSGFLAQSLPQYVDAIFADIPLPDTTFLPVDTLVSCDGEMRTLTARESGTTYSWSNGDTTATTVVSAPGTYCVTISGECAPVVDCQFVRPETTEIDPVTINRVDLGCEGLGLLVDLNVSAPFVGARLILYEDQADGGRRQIREYFISTDTVTLLQPVANQYYEVTVSFLDCGQELFRLPIQETTRRLEFDPRFLTGLEEGDNCPDRPLTLSVEAGDVGDIAEIIWFDGSDENPREFMTEVDAEYPITVISACNDTVDFTFMPQIQPFCDCDGQVPELITPNGDGVNETFGLYKNCPTESFNLTVYNRWGQIVYRSDNPDEPWDGTLNGTPQPSDMYLYLMRFQFEGTEDSETQVQEGSFMLVR